MKAKNETMAPCSGNGVEEGEEYNVLTPRKNLTIAVNYEVSMVDQFMAHKRKPRRSFVEPVLESTDGSSAITKSCRTSGSDLENHAPAHNILQPGDHTNEIFVKTNTNKLGLLHSLTTIENNEITSGKLSIIENQDSTKLRSDDHNMLSRRKSARERGKRGLSLARSRVRYDMQLVPPVKRNRAFLQQYFEDNRPAPRRSTRLNLPATGNAVEAENVSCRSCECDLPSPFLDDDTVIWIPSKRTEWEDSVSEMTAVCTSAAIRRYMMTTVDRSSNMTKPFHAPLSRDYIRDRVDIDDPLNGFQFRHREGGWLQGFILWTNFTTWTHYFKWDSLDPVSGFTDDMVADSADVSGELANELEAQPRSGDPHGEGVVFEGVAEIALVGGLGCGEYLLRMALECIKMAGSYRYVVLQATDSSKTFYERFGFVRVGAVCRYEQQPGEERDTSIMGYRHWTHANESAKSLQKHGGPSYMMCLKLVKDVKMNETVRCGSCGRELVLPSFLDRMMELAVTQKPTVESLGTSSATPLMKAPSRRNSGSVPDLSVPTTKRGRRASTSSLSSQKAPIARASVTTSRKSDVDPSSVQAPVSQPITEEIPRTTKKKVPAAAVTAEPNHKHTLPCTDEDQPPTKRRRIEPPLEETRKALLTPPSDGKTLSYAQKQYQSVWLAVPPTIDQKAARPPPKRRLSTETSTTSDTVNTQKVSVQSTSVAKRSAPISVKQSPAPARNLRPEPTPSKPLALGKKLVHSVDRTTLLKQKVKAYPRSRIHYYNRVVKAKNPPDSKQYYFVLQYDEPTGLIKIVPMHPKGTLSGKREGRPRFQAEIGETDENFLTVQASDFEVVAAAMVMKTPVVASEAWDIEED